MSLSKSLFKQTAIYGLATVLPRIISFILNPLFVKYLPDRAANGDVALIFAYLVFFNVILAYGMETAFFRFYNKEENKKSVISTAMVSLFWSSIAFLFIGLLFRKTVADWTNINIENITYAIWILVLDALVIIPFSRLRAEKRPMKYAVIKIFNVTINLLLNVFFLIFLPKWVQNPNYSWLKMLYYENFEVGYVFVAGLISS
ncbi:MAG: lipopolysaccharide biosynthesis protein, partial [Flectobacillus sp.]|uniref:lipopolysaccharide biosynthesis protein n=1 Tax=Flectobacillus sp. TaxID=50419 RepID=UPI003B9D3E22